MYFTWMSTFAGDLARGVEWVEGETGEEVVLVGHSSGGGIAQYVLSEGMGGNGVKMGGDGALKVKGLCLAGSIPGFGRYVDYTFFFLHFYQFVLHEFETGSSVSKGEEEDCPSLT